MSTQTVIAPREVSTSHLTAFLRLTSVQAKLFLRQPVALFFNIFFPLLLLLINGFIWGNDPGSSIFSRQFGYVDALVPALAALVIGTVAFMTIPVATATAREQKLLRRLQATPLPPFVYLAADVTVNFLVALTGMIIVVISGLLLFDLRFEGNYFAVAAAFTLSALAFIAVGYLIASLAPTSRVAQVVGQTIFFPMMFLSGAAIPLALMPANVREIAGWLPLTQIVELIQGLWYGGEWTWQPTLFLSTILVVGTLLSVRLFRWE